MKTTIYLFPETQTRRTGRMRIIKRRFEFWYCADCRRRIAKTDSFTKKEAEDIHRSNCGRKRPVTRA